jgi:LemA protein
MVLELILGGIVLVGIVGVLWLVFSYNAFIGLRNRIDNAWAQIDVQTKKRFDLIPNLVETVKGYAKHEKTVFENVTAARSRWMQAGTDVKRRAEAENMIAGALKSIMAISENYPDLKANQNFLMLQEELSGIESKIAFARQFYNDSVMAWNTKVQTFPDNVLAGIFSFKMRDYFQIEEAARAPVKVSF